MLFLPLALVTSAVEALFFVVAALWVRAVQGLFWLAGFGQGTCLVLASCQRNGNSLPAPWGRIAAVPDDGSRV